MSEEATKAKKMLDFIKNVSKRQWSAFAMASQYLSLQLTPTTFQPDAIIAGLPIYNEQHEGHAASDETLKYRSIGTIFLAHQKGGKRTFKCTLKIQGPARLYVLMFLQYLQRNGMEEGMLLSQFASNLKIDLFSADVAQFEPFVSPSANDKVKYMQGFEIEKEIIEWHKTFPIITDTKIYTNMYLETLRYVEDVELGLETMQIDLAFREFIPPMHVMWYIGDESEGKRGYYTTWLTNKERDSLRRVELLINGLWASRSYFGEIFNPNIQQKAHGKYFIEAGVLVAGLLLAKTTIWGK